MAIGWEMVMLKGKPSAILMGIETDWD